MDRIWLKNYQDNVPTDVDELIGRYPSLNDVLEENFKKFGPSQAWYCMGKSLTFAETEALSKKFASYLQNQLGLKKGDRVAIMLPNILQYPIALLGILRAGMVAVNVNPLYTPRELEHQLKDSGASVIVIFENACRTLQDVLPRTNVRFVLTTKIGDMLGFPKSLLVNFVIHKVKKMVPQWEIPGSISLLEAIAQGDAGKYKRPQLDQNDNAFLQYTGGTTGVAKGAELTHGNIVANINQAKSWISPATGGKDQIIITALPLYHIFSLTANCFVFMSIGALNVLITNPRDFKSFINDMKKFKFTAITGVNTLFNALTNHPDFRSVDFSHLKLTLGGGMAVQKAVAEKWKQITGVTLVEAYGLTETSPAACMNPMNLKEYNGFIGLPICSTSVTIKDDNEKTVDIGIIGEICIKGPQVMKGYWNRPEETAKVFSYDGFFKTGDVGYMTPDGFVKIVDRKKDMILVSGFNVYPNEVEDVVSMHPKVFECAAIGIPDEKSGEIVKIFIVKKDESLTSQEVIQHCKDNLTAYKVPKQVEFRTELPKSNVGKILRKELRDK